MAAQVCRRGLAVRSGAARPQQLEVAVVVEQVLPSLGLLTEVGDVLGDGPEIELRGLQVRPHLVDRSPR